MKWVDRGATNSNPVLGVMPRISVIVGIDSTGSIYLSLTQSNSNSKVMQIFFQQLVLKLDAERSNWREDTVILYDNAPYHCSATTMTTLE